MGCPIGRYSIADLFDPPAAEESAVVATMTRYGSVGLTLRIARAA